MWWRCALPRTRKLAFEAIWCGKLKQKRRTLKLFTRGADGTEIVVNDEENSLRLLKQFQRSHVYASKTAVLIDLVQELSRSITLVMDPDTNRTSEHREKLQTIGLSSQTAQPKGVHAVAPQDQVIVRQNIQIHLDYIYASIPCAPFPDVKEGLVATEVVPYLCDFIHGYRVYREEDKLLISAIPKRLLAKLRTLSPSKYDDGAKFLEGCAQFVVQVLQHWIKYGFLSVAKDGATTRSKEFNSSWIERRELWHTEWSERLRRLSLIDSQIRELILILRCAWVEHVSEKRVSNAYDTHFIEDFARSLLFRESCLAEYFWSGYEQNAKNIMVENICLAITKLFYPEKVAQPYAIGKPFTTKKVTFVNFQETPHREKLLLVQSECHALIKWKDFKKVHEMFQKYDYFEVDEDTISSMR